MARKRIAVVGDVFLDRYLVVDRRKDNPESCGGVYDVQCTLYGLGGAGAVAYHCRGSNVEVQLHGVIGRDASGRIVRNLLRVHGIDDALVACAGTTETKTRTLLGDRLGRDRYDRTAMRSARIRTSWRQTITPSDVLVIADYEKGTIRDNDCTVPWWLDRAADTIVDSPRAFYGATLVKRSINQSLPVRNGCAEMLITLAENGMVYIANGETEYFPAVAVDGGVKDATGAGDCVLGTLAKTMDMSRRQAIQMAAVEASKCCGHIGATHLM